jgi:hypothetical protein
MIKALRLTMILYAAVGILFGLAFIFAPRQLGTMLGHQEGPAYVAALSAEIGVCFISSCIFLIIAARDPLKHILWVKYAIVFAILMLAAGLSSLIRGYINFNQDGLGIIIHAVFTVALLAFYPWRQARSGE